MTDIPTIAKGLPTTEFVTLRKLFKPRRFSLPYRFTESVDIYLAERLIEVGLVRRGLFNMFHLTPTGLAVRAYLMENGG